MDIHFYPFGGRTIYIQEMYILRKNYMKFKGYFHEEEENLPVEKLLFIGKNLYWISIHGKTQSEMDTSGGFYDEEVGANICLFPSYVVELHFTVLLKNPSMEKYITIAKDIQEDHKLISEREDARWEAERAARLKDISKPVEVGNIVGGEQKVTDADAPTAPTAP